MLLSKLVRNAHSVTLSQPNDSTYLATFKVGGVGEVPKPEVNCSLSISVRAILHAGSGEVATLVSYSLDIDGVRYCHGGDTQREACKLYGELERIRTEESSAAWSRVDAKLVEAL
jgi:hypothetical protein